MKGQRAADTAEVALVADIEVAAAVERPVADTMVVLVVGIVVVAVGRLAAAGRGLGHLQRH